MRYGQVTHQGRVWVGKAEYAVSFFDRLRGLLGRPSLGQGAALLIERCGSVHTVGMRFVLDLVFLDKAWRIVSIVRGVQRGRLMVCGGWHAARVLESEAGCLDMGKLKLGDELRWQQG